MMAIMWCGDGDGDDDGDEDVGGGHLSLRSSHPRDRINLVS